MSSENRPKEESRENEGLRVGLCSDCRHMKRIESERGSTFYLCQRSISEPEFAKYPRLPVLECRGYERREK